jgi:Uma2 family endonuclease
MTAAVLPSFTEDEYFELERKGEEKHEFLRGAIVAMAGASTRHNLIAANLIAALRASARGGPCRVLTGDQRIHVESTGLYTYPDVTVVCGGMQFHPKHPDTLLNPKIIVEVLSDSTEAYDRGAKFAHYRSVPSLEEYVLVSQIERRIEHYRRVDGGQWLLTEIKGHEGALPLPALGCELRIADAYEDVEGLAGPPEYSDT